MYVLGVLLNELVAANTSCRLEFGDEVLLYLFKIVVVGHVPSLVFGEGFIFFSTLGASLPVGLFMIFVVVLCASRVSLMVTGATFFGVRERLLDEPGSDVQLHR